MNLWYSIKRLRRWATASLASAGVAVVAAPILGHPWAIPLIVAFVALIAISLALTMRLSHLDLVNDPLLDELRDMEAERFEREAKEARCE